MHITNFKKLRALSHFLSERCDTFKSVKKPVELMTLLRVSLRTILQYIKKVGAGKVFCVMLKSGRGTLLK